MCDDLTELLVCGQSLQILMGNRLIFLILGKWMICTRTIASHNTMISYHLYCDLQWFVCAIICLSSFVCGQLLQILLGIAVIFPILGKWMILLTTPLTKPGRAMMEALIPTKKTQFYGGEAVFEVPRNFDYHFVLIVF